jgi:cardiolipin synthase C
MTNYLLAILTSFLFISCSFHRAKSNKPVREYSADPVPKISIDKALSFSKKDLMNKTGIYTLENGGESLISRLWFFAHAQKTIDIQYYSFAKDVTGLIASDYIVRAAERGVKVRILIDDAASRMRSYEIQLLDSHPEIEVRVYNAGLMLGRLDHRINKLTRNSNRLLRRMHNKTLTIDDQVSMTGGRNIANEYFDYDHRYNFRDRDVLLIGKAVHEVKLSFEKFWNDTLTVIYSTLSGKNKTYNDSARFKRLHQDAAETKNFSAGMREKVKLFPKEIESAEKSGKLIWVESVSFVSDIPGKNEDKKDRKGGVCTDSLINLIKQAKISIDIQSPYFIMTDEVERLMKDAIERGVKIRLLTNSLASTDNHEAFSGYQRSREKIVKTGIKIYEFKPDAMIRYKLMIPEVQAGLNYKPVYGFHSKTIIIDSYISIIGSYNLDPRSANYNTECFAIIRSEKVAQHLFNYFEEEFLPENAWQITKDYNPDSKAGIKKRLKVASRRVIPKKVL